MTPLTKPQTGSPSVRPDQLTIPTSARSRSSNTGPPESPLQTPRPALSPSFRGSIRLSCCELGRSVATSVIARSLPAVLPSPCTPTPKPATMKRSAPAEGGRREIRRRRRKLDEGEVGGIGARRELRMGSDTGDVLHHGAAAFERQQPVFAVAEHAVCGRKHEIGCDRHAGA